MPPDLADTARRTFVAEPKPPPSSVATFAAALLCLSLRLTRLAAASGGRAHARDVASR
jgi:hypothetical protein